MDRAADVVMILELAIAAVAAGIDGDWDRTDAIVERIIAEHGGFGVAGAVATWCDLMIDHGSAGELAHRVTMATMNVETGAINRRSDHTPEVEWVMRLVYARATGNRAAFFSVGLEVNGMNGGARRSHLCQLVQSTALGLRALPRGHAQP